MYRNASYAYVFYNADNDTDDKVPVEFQYNPATGKFSTETYFGYYAHSLTGGKSAWYSVFCGAEAVKSADQSFGFAREMLVGDYDMVYVSAYDDEGLQDTMTISIEVIDTTSTGLLIKDMFFKGTEIRADFDVANNQVVIEDWQTLAIGLASKYDAYFATVDLEKVILDVCADGTMLGVGSRSSKNSLFGAYLLSTGTTSQLGWYDRTYGDVLFLHHEEAADGVQARVASRSNDTYYNVFSDVRKAKVSTLANPVLFHYNGK